MIERLHSFLLDVIKDEFERLGVLEINTVQALLLFNIGENEVTAGELKSREYYQGSNVSYNLKKLVDLGYMHHQRCEMDRRSVRVKLTAKGRDIRETEEQIKEFQNENSEDKQKERATCGYAYEDTIKSGVKAEKDYSKRIPYSQVLGQITTLGS